MTNREYVLRACQIRGLDVLKPTKLAHEVLIYRGHELMVDAKSWKEARAKLEAWNLRQAP